MRARRCTHKKKKKNVIRIRTFTHTHAHKNTNTRTHTNIQIHARLRLTDRHAIKRAPVRYRREGRGAVDRKFGRGSLTLTLHRNAREFFVTTTTPSTTSHEDFRICCTRNLHPRDTDRRGSFNVLCGAVEEGGVLGDRIARGRYIIRSSEKRVFFSN